MKVIHYSRAEAKVFDQDPAKGVTGRVVIGKADRASNFCMRVFELSPEGHTPRHSHSWEHEIFVHTGKGALWQDGKWIDVERGHVVFIPGGEEHQFKNLGDGPFVFVCLIPAGVAEI